jgi:hypothetical protein
MGMGNVCGGRVQVFTAGVLLDCGALPEWMHLTVRYGRGMQALGRPLVHFVHCAAGGAANRTCPSITARHRTLYTLACQANLLNCCCLTHSCGDRSCLKGAPQHLHEPWQDSPSPRSLSALQGPLGCPYLLPAPAPRPGSVGRTACFELKPLAGR